jgi:hypothetical protein
MPHYDINLKFRAIHEFVICSSLGNNMGQCLQVGADASGASPRTVRRWMEQWCQTYNMDRKKGSGRRPILNTAQEAEIHRLADEEPYLSAEELAANLDLSVSRHTIRKVLESFGVFRRVVRRKAHFREANLQRRLDWANEFIDRPVEFWDKVVWLDEISIDLVADGRIWIHRTVNTPFAAHNTWKAKQRGLGMKVIFIIVPYYGYVSYRLPDTSKRTRAFASPRPAEKWDYKCFLKYFKEFKVELDVLFGNEDYSLVMDHASEHLGAIPAINALPRVSVLDWCPRSQDLNIIENWFSKLKSNLKWNKFEMIRDGHLVNFQNLRVILKEAVEEVGSDHQYMLNLSGSMPGRISEVISNDGNACRY